MRSGNGTSTFGTPPEHGYRAVPPSIDDESAGTRPGPAVNPRATRNSGEFGISSTLTEGFTWEIPVQWPKVQA